MIKGTFLDMWRWTDARTEIPQAVHFCAKKQITDLFVMMGRRDKGTLINHPWSFDQFNLIKAIPFRPQRLHAWMDLLILYRSQNKINDNIPDSWMMSDSVVPANMRDIDDETGTTREIFYLNPLMKQVQDFIVSKVISTCASHDVDGLCLDKVRFPYDQKYWFPEVSVEDKQKALDSIVQRISEGVRRIKPNIIISLPVAITERNNLCDFKKWIANGWIDKAIPMLFGKDGATLNEKIQTWRVYKVPTWWGVDCKEPFIGRLILRKLEGEDVLLYSYPYWRPWA